MHCFRARPGLLLLLHFLSHVPLDLEIIPVTLLLSCVLRKGRGYVLPVPLYPQDPAQSLARVGTLDNSGHQLDENLAAVSVLRTSLDSRLGDKKTLSVLRSDTYADDSVG